LKNQDFLKPISTTLSGTGASNSAHSFALFCVCDFSFVFNW